SMIVSLARQLFVLVPAAYLLARLGASTGNSDLVWFSFPIAEIASLITTLILFVRLYKNVILPVPEGSDA
ncbi:MAG: MATE family efflux transporter, partial [bacterium]